jgi:hypothetical protein
MIRNAWIATDNGLNSISLSTEGGLSLKYYPSDDSTNSIMFAEGDHTGNSDRA